MKPLSFYEVVRLLDTPANQRLGIAGEMGVVVGIAEEGDYLGYAVLIGDETWSTGHDDVATTGNLLQRDDIYSGAVLRLDSAGNIIGHTDADE
jgi:hypothetical protein